MRINRRQLLAGTVAAPFLHIPGRAASSKPNVVFFMTDDHGAWTLGSYGCSGMHTPNLDKLASEGARFTRAFACTPVCSPSRMTYLTGVIPAIHGVQDWLQPPDSFGVASQKFLAGHLTYADLIAKAGYTLGMCGKWHMGHDDEPQCGFSYWRTVPGGGGTYKDPEFVVNGQRRKVEGYKTDIVTDFALEFLDKSKNRPFFLQVPYYAPHTPYNYQPEVYRQWYKDSDFRCFPRHSSESARQRGAGQPAWQARAEVGLLGADFGRGLQRRPHPQRLDEMGVRENTLVVFTADQGWNAGHHGFWGKGNGTWPLNMYEESLRVPLIWNHPGKIREGQVLNPMVSSYDYFPSILGYLGISAPPDPHRIGASYVPFLRGESPALAEPPLLRVRARPRHSHREPEIPRAHQGVAQRALRPRSRPRRNEERHRRPQAPQAGHCVARRPGRLLQIARRPAHRKLALHRQAEAVDRIQERVGQIVRILRGRAPAYRCDIRRI